MVRLVLVGALVAGLATAAAAHHAGPVRGSAGDDRLIGTAGDDDLHGLGGADVLRGLGGSDVLDGGPGADDIRGDAGPDLLYGGRGRDIVRGGPGTDLINVDRDGAGDIAVCGPGKDTVSADLGDVVATDCERLVRRLPAGSAPTAISVEFLGWEASRRSRIPNPAVPLPQTVPSGATMTACSRDDEIMFAYLRLHGISRLTARRTELVYPKGSRIVSFDSVRPRDEGDPSVIYIVRGGPEMSNGAYTLRVQVEASGVYTPVGEATVTRACP